MKANIKRWVRGAGAGLVLGGMSLITAGCAGTATTYTAASPYGEDYEYEYYPDWNVYYYPAADTYTWYEQDHWRSSRHLPPRYTIGHARHEPRRFQSPEPWMEHGDSSEAATHPYPTPDDFAAHGD
jgi:hypothetical protein